jgi:hypothetical protein
MNRKNEEEEHITYTETDEQRTYHRIDDVSHTVLERDTESDRDGLESRDTLTHIRLNTVIHLTV